MRFTEISQNYARQNVKYHKDLNPVAWDGETMKSDVRARLLEIADIFIDYLEIDNFEVFDIVLTGSMANFNWTKYSDFDLHVVTDYDYLNCPNLAEAFYQAKKKIWNDNHDITIGGYDVELYVEDNDEPPVSQGMFSIMNNKWLNVPEHNPPSVDAYEVNSKAQLMIDTVTRVLRDAKDPVDLKKLMEKIRNMRRAGLDEGGEFSVENLVFKILRNRGYIKHIHDAMLRLQDQQLSM